MLSARRKPLSQAEQDCLTVYSNAILVNYGHDPDSTALQATSAYKRGAALYKERHGGRESWELGGEANRAALYFNVCRRNFQIIHRQEPRPGDVLTFEQFTKADLAVRLFTLDNFRTAWEREIPELPFPFKVEGGQLFRRVRCDKWCVASGTYSQDERGTWEKERLHSEITWSLVEETISGERQERAIASPLGHKFEQIVFGEGILLAPPAS